MHIGETQLEDEARVVCGFFLELCHFSSIAGDDHLEVKNKQTKKHIVNKFEMQSGCCPLHKDASVNEI